MKQLGLGIVAAIGGAIGQAAAAELPKEGTYDVRSCYTVTSNDITFSKTISASSYELIGVGLSNPPGGIFDQMSFRCVGSSMIIDGTFSATTTCEAVDKDGDKILTRLVAGFENQEVTLSSDHTGGTTVIAGTGKYEGMTRTGANENYPMPSIKQGTFQRCGRQTGTYKLK